MRDVDAIARVLERDSAQVPLRVDIDQRVLVELTRFGSRRGPEFDAERVRILKVRDLHGATRA